MIGVIGGSGAYRFPGLSIKSQLDVKTRFGSPSAQLTQGVVDGHSLLFLPRHGKHHQIPPHKINYRANIQALKEAGATHVVALNAVGSIVPECQAPDLAIPDQIIDYTYGREHTFFDGGDNGVDHIDFTYPYSREISEILLNTAATLGLRCMQGCVYAAMQGPRLESAAEIDRLERDGAQMVGMTGMPEAALAREAGLRYAAICIVVNAAAGRGAGEITMESIKAFLESGVGNACSLITAALPALQALE